MYGDQQDPRLQQLLAMMMGGRGGMTPASLMQLAPPGLAPPGTLNAGGQYGGPGLGQYSAGAMPSPNGGGRSIPSQPGNYGGGGEQNLPKAFERLLSYKNGGYGPTPTPTGSNSPPEWGNGSTTTPVTDWGTNSGLGQFLGLNAGGPNNGYARSADMLAKLLNLGQGTAKAATAAAGTTAGTAAAATTAADAAATGAAATGSEALGAGATAAKAAAAGSESSGILSHILSWLAAL